MVKEPRANVKHPETLALLVHLQTLYTFFNLVFPVLVCGYEVIE